MHGVWCESRLNRKAYLRKAHTCQWHIATPAVRTDGARRRRDVDGRSITAELSSTPHPHQLHACCVGWGGCSVWSVCVCLTAFPYTTAVLLNSTNLHPPAVTSSRLVSLTSLSTGPWLWYNRRYTDVVVSLGYAGVPIATVQSGSTL